MKDEKVLSIEEFTELVKKKYLEMGPGKNVEENLRYLNGREAQEHIRTSYNYSLEDYKEGMLGDEGFRIGEVAKVAYCLFMMFE